MNTLIYGMHWKSQEQAMKELEKDGIINIKAWIGKRKHNSINIGKYRQAIVPKEVYSGINKEIYSTVYNESFSIFLDMFRRNPSTYYATHSDIINLYNYLYDYNSKLLEDNKIELLIFYNLPHFGSDYLLIVIAKYLNIKTLMMYQSSIPNRFHYITDLNDFGKFKTAKILFDYPKQKVNFNHKKIQFYMKNIKVQYKSCNFNLLVSLRRFIFRRSSRMSFLWLIKNYIDCFVFKYNYNKYMVDNVDLSKKYVYFPLQLQPELPTSTLGGIYVDQLLAIEKLFSIIPNDWKIYVKENPKQLASYRGPSFFKRLSLIKNAVYVSKKVNSFELIDNCEFVSTISGTAGWEAITSDKNCVIFGMAWYQEFDGIFKYSDSMNYKTVVNHKADKEQVEKYYNSLIKTTANGIVDNGHVANYKEYDDISNTKYLKESIEKIIRSL